MVTIASITSMGEETSLELLTGNGRLVYTVSPAVSAWTAGAAVVNGWSAEAPRSAWAAGGVTV